MIFFSAASANAAVKFFYSEKIGRGFPNRSTLLAQASYKPPRARRTRRGDFISLRPLRTPRLNSFTVKKSGVGFLKEVPS